MNKTEKMTNRKALEYVKNNFDLPTEVAEKVDGMIAQLVKKNSADRKPTAQQVANEGIKETIVAVLTANGEPMTVTDIIKADPDLSELTNQKVSALLRPLVEGGKVVKVIDKRKSYFQIAE